MPEIHPTALVADGVQLAEDVMVGPYAVLEGEVEIGPRTTIATRALVTGRVRIGEDNTIGPGAIIGSDPQSLSFDPATDSGVVIGDGNTLREYVTINRATSPGGDTGLGDRNYLMTGAHLAHDVQLGSDNILANNALLAGHIVVGDRAFIGGGAACHQFIHIGDLAMIAGNASLTRDVPPYCMTTRDDSLAGLNTIGLRRAGFDQEARNELKRLYRLLFLHHQSRADALAAAAGQSWSEAANKLLAAVAEPGSRGVLSD